MRILIDALQMLPGRAVSGALVLKHQLRSLAEVDPNNEYLLLTPPGREREFLPPQAPNFTEATIPFVRRSLSLRFLWEQWFLPQWAEKNSFDLLYAPMNIAPLASASPVVLHLQTMVMFTHPQEFRGPRSVLLRWLIHHSAVRAKKVAVVSQSLTRTVQTFLPIPPNKIRVVYHGVGPPFSPLPRKYAQKILWEKRRITPPFLLSVVNPQPSTKNLGNLLLAFSQVYRDYPQLKLLLCGGAKEIKDYGPKAVRLLEDKNLAERVFFLGYCSQEELALLYNSAEFLVIPSLCESFGLPLLEAMACGCPVLSSDAPALPEIGGGSALYVNARDPQAMAEKIRELLEDKNLQNTLKERGLERAKSFTWKANAEALFTLFQEALSQGT